MRLSENNTEPGMSMIFCDGICRLWDNFRQVCRKTISWIDILDKDRLSLDMQIFFGSDLNSSIAYGKPFCISFSSVTRQHMVSVPAIYVTAPYAQLVFNTPVFERLKNILLDPMRTKICATRSTAHEVHAAMQHSCKVTIAHFTALTDTIDCWLQLLLTKESIRIIHSLLACRIEGGPFFADPQVVTQAITTVSFSQSAANALGRRDRSALALVILRMDRTMAGIQIGEFQRPKRVAAGAPSPEVSVKTQ
jgi:hypothetical protein